MIRETVSFFVPLTTELWMQVFLPSSQAHSKFASDRLGQMLIL
jgi:hypothetical protein